MAVIYRKYSLAFFLTAFLFAVPSVSAQSSNACEGTVGCYGMNQSSGDLLDYSGNNYDLSRQGSPDIVSGAFGDAVDFNDLDEEFFGTNTGYSDLTITGDLTFSFWIKDVENGNVFLAYEGGSGETQSENSLYYVNTKNSNLNYIHEYGDGQNEGYVTNIGTQNTFKHITVRRDSSAKTVEFFENGTQVDSFSYSNQPGGSSNEALNIGARFNNQYLDGTIDEVKIFSQTLTDSEINNIYSENTINPGSTEDHSPSVSNPSPSDGATGVSNTTDLKADVSDPDGDTLSGGFYNATDDSEIASFTGISSGSTVSTSSLNLGNGVTVDWYVNVSDGSTETQSATFSFTTEDTSSNLSKPDACAGSPLLCYHFNETSSPTEDFSGNNNDGVWKGGVTGIQDGVVSNTDGAWKDGRAISLDGTGYVKDGQLSEWTNNFENAWSSNAWVRTTSSADGSNRQSIYGIRRESGNQNTWNLLEAVGDTGTSGASPNVWVSDANSNSVKFGADPNSQYAVNDGEWHHVAVTYDGQGNGVDSYTLYVDGTEVPSGDLVIEKDNPQSSFNDITKDVTFGSYYDEVSEQKELLTGDLDEIKIFAGEELTSTEVSNLNKYNSINEPSNSKEPTVNLISPNDGDLAVDDVHYDSKSNLPIANLTVSVSDPDNSTVDVKFYNDSDNSLLKTKSGVNLGGSSTTVKAQVTGSFGEKLDWYANVTDGINTVQSSSKSFRYIRENSDDTGVLVLPDTQNYVDGSTDASKFTDQTEYACDLYESGMIDMVVHNGDLVSTPSSDTEWDRANNSISVLDSCDAPYTLAVGNHDMDGIADTRNHPKYNTYFPESRVSNEEWFGGSKNGELDNYYTEFESGGKKFMVITLEFCPTQSQIQWANNTVANNPDRNVLFNTHNYLYTDSTRVVTGGNNDPDCSNYGVSGYDGNQMWNEFVSYHGNIFQTNNGHNLDDGTGLLVSQNKDGLDTAQIMSNFQMLSNGGNGYLRYQRINHGQDRISVKSYSPTLDQFDTSPDQDFVLSENFGLDNGLPTAGLSANTTDIQTGDTVLLDASGSTDSDGSITQYDYDPDGDGTFEETAAGSTLENKYSSVGSFDATVRVTDDDGATSTAVTTITVGSPPTADITANTTTIKTGETVEFDASGSTDPGGSITSTEFDLDNDGTFENSGTTAQKKFSSSGTFTVDVRVTDSDSNTDTASVSVTVNKRDFFVENLPPGLEAGFPGNLGADPTSTNPVTEGNTKNVVFGPDKNNGRVAAGLEIAFNSNVSASAVDSNANRSQGKSYVHLTSSISEVQQKNLYIPRENNTGRTHICPGATSLSETFLGCSNGFNISTGETVNGVTLSEVTLGGGLYSSGDNYYKAAGVTGTGGVEVSSSGSNTGGGGSGGGGGGGGGFGADGNISWDEFSATAPVNSTKTFTFEAVNNVEEEVTVSLSVPDTRECSFFELRNPSSGEGFGDSVDVDVSAKSNGVPGAASVEARVDMPGRGSLGSDDVLFCDLTESASSGEAVDLELRVEPGSSVLGSLGATIQNTIGLDTGGLGSGPTVEFLSITGGEQEESGFTVPWIVILGVLAGAVYFVTQR